MDWTKLLQARKAFNLRRMGPLGRAQQALRLPSMIRLAWALLRDERVPLPLKVATCGALGLVFSPLDLLQFVPLVGQISDIILVVTALDLFIENSPKDVVREHIKNLGLQKKFKV